MAKLEAVEYKSFEAIKQTDDLGNEFWYARDLQKVLNYAKWENFSKVVDKAMLACKNSGVDIEMPKTAEKQVVDYKLTRYACYLTNNALRIAEN